MPRNMPRNMLFEFRSGSRPGGTGTWPIGTGTPPGAGRWPGAAAPVLQESEHEGILDKLSRVQENRNHLSSRNRFSKAKKG